MSMSAHGRKLIPVWVFSAGLLWAATLLLIGCDYFSSSKGGAPDGAAGGKQSAPQHSQKSAAKEAGHAHSSAPSKPPLDGWPEPRGVLVISGEQHGYIEPCGCTELQSGGLARRADFIRKIEKRGWPVVGLELGGTVDVEALQRRGLQTWFKFQTLLAALKDMNYAALGLGPGELKIPLDRLLTTNNFSASELPAMVSANTVVEGFEDYGPANSRLVEVGDVRIGVVSIIGDSYQKKVFPEGSDVGIHFTEAEAAVRESLQSLQEQQPDLLVLLSHASVAESRELATKFPKFNVVVTAGGPEDPAPEPEHVGETMFLKVGRKGKHVGALGIYSDSAKQPLRFELVNLDKDRFDTDPRMRQHMRDYQELLEREQEQVFADMAAASHPKTLETGATYVGAAKCGECHTKAYEKWLETPHSGGYQSLIDGREGEVDPIPRVYDPECLACHVTGWDPENKLRYAGGFLTEQLAQSEGKPHLFEMLKDQQCENCHGPGSRHVAFEEGTAEGTEEEATAARKAMWIGKEESLQSFCIRCHDTDNDPHFPGHEEEYWEQIAHPWRD